MTSTDELDWCGKEEEEGVLQGEAGDQATVVGVLMTRSGHLDHVVHHDHHARKTKEERYEEGVSPLSNVFLVIGKTLTYLPGHKACGESEIIDRLHHVPRAECVWVVVDFPLLS